MTAVQIFLPLDTNILPTNIFRHVPIVGSFYNWLSPVPDEAKAKGRCLNLKEGKLESTESIYKHHMQVRDSFKIQLLIEYLISNIIHAFRFTLKMVKNCESAKYLFNLYHSFKTCNIYI